MRTFGGKILRSGGRDGLLVCREGLSGLALTSGHLAVREMLQEGARIVVVTGADLAALQDSDGLVALIAARHFELRTEQTYRSI